MPSGKQAIAGIPTSMANAKTDLDLWIRRSEMADARALQPLTSSQPGIGKTYMSSATALFRASC